MTTDHGDELRTDRSQRHWRLTGLGAQAGGGLAVVRQRARRSMQQIHLAVLGKTFMHRGGDRRHPPWRWHHLVHSGGETRGARRARESCGGDQSQRRWFARSTDHGELALVRVKRRS